ncbi:MAG: hypothetical protein Greene07147_715 [Parcubacteria group bacterium Greene0714_7]|nr:MAG: hypothetical protein Greene07147_715 [Parcubacteria group bacterium Greene0714_7]
MGQGSFDKESFSKPSRIFRGTRIKDGDRKFSPVGSASRNSHQKKNYNANKDRLATQGVLDDE